ncbi:MAG: phosphatase PAP2 family protein, partial [Acidimicrobiia bacterium]|nr:phosphatase PAP2 family protein [Acidimicrobiia bacterium]
AKGHYDYVRPISMIRHMGGLGQSSDHDGPSYHPDGLPLVDGLVEVVTAETTAPGARHVHLAGHEGEIAVRAWTGTPDDPERETAGVDWIRAVEWVPYQKPSFVTPAFAGYISGHSTFSRAAAEVLAGITGSEYFPGGLGEWTIPAGSLEFEAGPAGDITLQWAAYADAADQAGISRLYGGIHVRADDLAGRVAGEQIGIAAWNKASTYFGG